jgi:heat shock protein HslJ
LEKSDLRYALHLPAVAATAILAVACGATREVTAPTATLPVESSSAVKTLQVAPSRVACTGVAPQMCLQVRESADAAWSLLYEEIAGFAYVPGYLYEIRIKEETVANPPADASAIRRTLVAIVSKTAVSALVGPTWRLVTLEGRDVVAGTHVTAAFDDEGRVSGSAGCNRYFGPATVTGEQVAVGVLASTRMFCGADGVMAQEDAYFAALGKAKAYRIVDGELRLGPEAGAVTLVYRAE